MVLAPRLGTFDRPWQAGVRRCMGHEVVSPVRSMGLMHFDFSHHADSGQIMVRPD
jgi:hypothetical protein